MRCVDVIRELSAPTGALATAEHLRQCPSCASWAERSARLDRLWDATRSELAPEAWEQIWANVSDALDRDEAPALAPARLAFRRWRRTGTVLFALAQAAVLLVGFALLYVSRPESGPRAGNGDLAARAIETPPVAVEMPIHQIPQEVCAVVSLDDQKVREVSIDLASNDGPNEIDPFFTLYNDAESLASLQ